MSTSFTTATPTPAEAVRGMFDEWRGRGWEVELSGPIPDELTQEQALDLILRLLLELDSAQAGRVAKAALSHSTRLNYPGVAGLLDAGDVQGAAALFLTGAGQ